MRVRRVHRRTELAVLAFQVLFGDPTGPAAESSNGYSNAFGVQLINELLQRGHAISVDLSYYIVLDEGRGLSHEDDTRLMAGVQSPLRHQKWKGSLGGVVRAVGGYIQELGQFTSPNNGLP